MPEVRIILYNVEYDYSDYGHDSFSIIDSISDWETITDQELNLLRRYIDKEDFGKGYYPLLLVKDDVPVFERIKNIKAYVKRLELKHKKYEEELKKKEEARKEKSAAKKAEKERKMLEKLKEKYEPSTDS